MSYENILFDKYDGIAKITFNRPKVLNALNRKTIEELRSALLDARDDAGIRVLILTGSGEKAFVASPSISLDYAVAERTSRAAVVPAGRSRASRNGGPAATAKALPMVLFDARGGRRHDRRAAGRP